ncbi:hypothetical protein GCM10007886_26140 [Methylobacterium gregans]|uniref:Uncharacterized protein n=1 Tax=Methylobacterium gregans TaxID=374424 RepID=A0AA37MA82_9HYPH|nr:hypothetical protein [Methylobacterium gregans]MDQ0521267.1 hypothetical protein [Methylobacterium gregans]GJD78480.1 hypothetical protein NBEOAGPD_1695 [Methylobacterium gregans]GLS54431.1 hypothetical protein GCM10007886_26140 [Methylobacterium gregans]
MPSHSLSTLIQSGHPHTHELPINGFGTSNERPSFTDGASASSTLSNSSPSAELSLRSDRLATRRQQEAAIIGLRSGLYSAVDSLRPHIDAVLAADTAPPDLRETLDRIELMLAYAQTLARFVQHDIDGCVDHEVLAPPAVREHGFYGTLLSDLCVGLIEGDPTAGSAAKRQLLDYAQRQLAWRLHRRVGDTATENQTCSTFGLRGLHRLIVEVRDYDAEAVLFAVLSHLKPTLCGFGRGAALERPRSFYARLALYRQRYPASVRAGVNALFSGVLDRHYADALDPEGPRNRRAADHCGPTASGA